VETSSSSLNKGADEEVLMLSCDCSGVNERVDAVSGMQPLGTGHGRPWEVDCLDALRSYIWTRVFSPASFSLAFDDLLDLWPLDQVFVAAELYLHSTQRAGRI
jgi:hypothetical protein